MLNFIKRGIQWKLLLTMIGFVVVLVASLTFVQIRAQKRILEKELERRIELMNQNLSDRGKTLSDNLGRQAENDIASFNLSYVTELIKKVVNEDKELAYAILMASDCTAYIHTLRPELQQEILSEDEDRFAASQEAATINEYERNDDSFREFIVPLRVSIEPWGVLRLGFTLDLLNEEIVNSHAEIAKQTRDMFIRSVMTSIVFIFLSALIVLFISTRLSKPLILLTESARQLAKGNFAAVANIEFRSEDEVGVLADTFAEMAKDLEVSYEALRERERQLAQFLEAIPVGVFVLDGSGKPYYANQTSQKILGKGIVPQATPDQLAETYQTYIAGTDQEYPTDQMPIVRALGGESVTIDDMEIRHPDRAIPIQAWASPIFDENRQIVYAIAAFQDITQRKQAEKVLAENLRKTQELEQARAVQLSMVPKTPPHAPRLEISFSMKTATEVGGDYYDFFPQNDGSLYIVTGDATGHGMAAGMMVSMTKAALNTLDVESPDEMIKQLNRTIRRIKLGRIKMALNVTYIRADGIEFSSAAMPSAFLYPIFGKYRKPCYD